ncbi:hypothetical protein BKA56DRAFT_626139 [Ilyonectria sp. MPI-CAGE-AT-0026]|nr:hypothetical protein BKA56DRAFT_626139 [Ilyonectria sp. MPI-CAGE-AT-0026]
MFILLQHSGQSRDPAEPGELRLGSLAPLCLGELGIHAGLDGGSNAGASECLPSCILIGKLHCVTDATATRKSRWRAITGVWVRIETRALHASSERAIGGTGTNLGFADTDRQTPLKSVWAPFRGTAAQSVWWVLFSMLVVSIAVGGLIHNPIRHRK